MIKSKGFSLIELLAALVIMAVITAIALPAYQGQVIKVRRSVAKAELLEVVARLEEYFVNNKSYTNDLTALGYPAAGYFLSDNGEASEHLASDSIYWLEVVTDNNDLNYTLTAKPQGGQIKDSHCGALAVDSQGIRTITGGGSLSKCW